MCLAIKRGSSLIFRNIRSGYCGGIYVTVSGKWIPRKFVKDHKFSGWEIYFAKLECADIGYIRAMNGGFTSSIKIKKDPITLKEMCEKIQKSINCGIKISKTQIAKAYLATF